MTSYRLNQLEDLDLSNYYPEPPISRNSKIWTRANFATAINGVIKVDGRSDGVSGAGDKVIFKYLRNQCDAILVGASTAKKENYSVPNANQLSGKRPRLVILSNSLDISPDAKFLSQEDQPLIVTSEKSATDKSALIDRLSGQLEVATMGNNSVDLSSLSDFLVKRNYSKVLCEGGPSIFSQLLRHQLIDELCLTISPLIAPGKPTGIAQFENNFSTKLSLASCFSVDGFLFCRYLVVKS